MFCVTQATDIPLSLEAVLDPLFESELDIPKMYRRVGLSYLVFNPPWLVVWNIIFMTFHILGIIIPTDFNSIIFQRGRYTTNQIIYHTISYTNPCDGLIPGMKLAGMHPIQSHLFNRPGDGFI